MPHTLIIGTTESGKTTLAKHFCAERTKGGRNTLVLDPMFDQWQATRVFHDKDEFLQTAWLSESCDLFIDEAGDAIGQYDKLMTKLATRGRHWGHNCYFITQRANMLALTVRTQCKILCCFAIDPDDAKVLAQNWNQKAILDAPNLAQGEFLYIRRFHPIRKMKVF